MLFERTSVGLSRSTSVVVSLLLKNLLVGILVGIIYINQAKVSEPLYINSQPSTGVQSANSLMFLGIIIIITIKS